MLNDKPYDWTKPAISPVPNRSAFQAPATHVEPLNDRRIDSAVDLQRDCLEAKQRLINVPGSFTLERRGARIRLPIEDGCVFVVSDPHYYDGEASPAHKAALILADQLKPYALVANGDVLDFASISRWSPVSFSELCTRPTVAAELSQASERLGDFERLPYLKYRVWNLGNHDVRFEKKLCEQAPQYEGVPGFSLHDHFLGWLMGWRTDFSVAPGTAPELIIKHKFKGGMHAGQNNALWTGTSIVTGHDHMLKAYTLTNVRRLVWGIHAGTLAPIDSPHFTHYTEDNVVNWQSGFAILHFREGRFTGPELVHVEGSTALFRGDVLRVS